MDKIVAKAPTKRQMLERLQFSKNLQVAIKASRLLSGAMTENEITGGFLTAVCKDDYKDALLRADDHNKVALIGKDFTVQNCMYIKPDNSGFKSGGVYYLKVQIIENGIIEVTPPVDSDCEVIQFTNLLNFSYTFKPTWLLI